MLIRNKKGDAVSHVGGHTIEIVLAVLCMLALLAFAAMLFLNWWDNGYKEILKKIDEKIIYLKNPSYTMDYVYVRVTIPEKANDNLLYLKSFKEGFFPEKECVGLYESCLCVCDTSDCSGAKKCQGFKDEIKISSIPDNINEMKSVKGNNFDGGNCWCYEKTYGSEWKCNSGCDCIGLSKDDRAFTIAVKMADCFDSVFTKIGDFSSESYLDVLDIDKLGRELKIQKNKEVIEILKSDR